MLIEINDPNDPYLKDIQGLYEATFPLCERRLWKDFRNMLSDNAMHVEVIEQEWQFAGFVIWWQIKDWIYIEHLAIVPEQRGRKLGENLMEFLKQLSGERLVLETEPPLHEGAIRRINFYKRQGFYEVPLSYMQPPYRNTEEPIPMLLMTTQLPENVAEYEKLVGLIKREVYEKFY